MVTRVRGAASRTFRSLHNRNFRVFFLGQLVSMCGSWMQIVAQGWLVLRLSHNSGSALGVVTALQFLPVLVIGAWSGVVVDRFDKRKLLIVTQSGAAIMAGALAALTLSGVVELWMVYLLAFLTGFITAFDNPARQTFVSELVNPDDLSNAIGLNSAMFNMARIAGPALAGVLISLVDVGPCFAFNAVSFVAVIFSLLVMDTSALVRQPPVPRAKRQVREGLSYVWHTSELRLTLLVMAVVGTLAFNFQVVVPLLAKLSFHGNAGTYGLLSSVMGAGSLIGALGTASRHKPTAKVLLVSCVAFGAFMLATSMAPSLALALPLLVVTGAMSMTFMATANTTLQLGASPSMRGRVMALYTLVFLGSTPIGGPLIGFISQHFGPRVGFGIGGASAVVAGLVAAFSLARKRRTATQVTDEPAVAGLGTRAALQPARG
jgi:MFS family permease